MLTAFLVRSTELTPHWFAKHHLRALFSAAVVKTQCTVHNTRNFTLYHFFSSLIYTFYPYMLFSLILIMCSAFSLFLYFTHSHHSFLSLTHTSFLYFTPSHSHSFLYSPHDISHFYHSFSSLNNCSLSTVQSNVVLLS